MSSDVSDCLDHWAKELFCCLTGRYGSIQIPRTAVTQKQRVALKGTRCRGYLPSGVEKSEAEGRDTQRHQEGNKAYKEGLLWLRR